MVVPPSLGSVIAVPAQLTWYWRLTCPGSSHAPAVFVFEPRLKLLALREVPPAGYVQWPVSDSTVPPDPIWWAAWVRSTVQLLRTQPRRLSSAQVPPSAESVSRTLIWSRSPDPRYTRTPPLESSKTRAPAMLVNGARWERRPPLNRWKVMPPYPVPTSPPERAPGFRTSI